LHLVSIPLMGIGAAFLKKKLRWPVLGLGLLIVLAVPVYKANANYLWLNRVWIKQANESFRNDAPDLERLVAKIKDLPPGRVYAGSPGNWGREFKIGSTSIYLALSTTGLPINGFLPESWSLNTDPEMFFDYTDPQSYQLFNVRYLVTPTNFELPKFAQKVADYGRFRLSQVQSTGYFDIGTSNFSVSTSKTNILNIIHLWLESLLPAKKEFPTLNLTDKNSTLPDSFLPQPLSYPLPQGPQPLGKIISETASGDQQYSAKFEVSQDCQNCLIVFKMTYHPNWKVTLDGAQTQKLMVFPSYLAAAVTQGTHEITFEYQASRLKLPLVVLGLASLILITTGLKKLMS